LSSASKGDEALPLDRLNEQVRDILHSGNDVATLVEEQLDLVMNVGQVRVKLVLEILEAGDRNRSLEVSVLDERSSIGYDASSVQGALRN
jgi:hypothetical protein